MSVFLLYMLYALFWMHFDEGLFARHKGGESTKVVTKGLRGKSASKKLTEEGLVKFSTRVSIQTKV
ncbi:hypothetical protein GLYMA_04G073626v4 [Glycine max]|nr:hypothetical protein GLYMA_04G073626v4 [Glycine max]KAH1110251.1 hypothetical protein GYH30_009226 [Glycine max]